MDGIHKGLVKRVHFTTFKSNFTRLYFLRSRHAYLSQYISLVMTIFSKYALVQEVWNVNLTWCHQVDDFSRGLIIKLYYLYILIAILCSNTNIVIENYSLYSIRAPPSKYDSSCLNQAVANDVDISLYNEWVMWIHCGEWK